MNSSAYLSINFPHISEFDFGNKIRRIHAKPITFLLPIALNETNLTIKQTGVDTYYYCYYNNKFIIDFETLCLG